MFRSIHLRGLLSLALFTSLMGVAACSDTEVPTCAEASELLSACTSQYQSGCGDDDPAAEVIASCSSNEKADFFGNGVPGDSCFWNWQCKGDEAYSCNHGNCFRRNTVGNLCDRRDDEDCLPELYCADDLSSPKNIDGICSTSREAVIPALYAETIRPGEELDFAANALQLLRIMIVTAMQRANGDTSIKRAFHAKNHACVRGEFQVFDTMPEDMKVGPVFSEAKNFPAWIRFSNGTITMTPDEDSVVQGMGIKLLGVEGEKILSGDDASATTQDFLMINLPATPTSNANEFVEFAQAQFDGNLAMAAYLLTHPVIAARGISLTALKTVESVRTESYWAGGAYRFGERAMKYSARPCAGTPAATPVSGDNYLREELEMSLMSGELCFDFYMQIQNDAVAQSIEDTAVRWRRGESEAIHMARLTIPQVDLSTTESLLDAEICDDFSFHPWHSSPEYRPLGVVNRARRRAYEASRTRRGSSAEPLAPQEL